MSPVPEPLRWAALITGTRLPEADPALLRQQGEVWGDLAQQLMGMMGEVKSVRNSVLANVNGTPAEAFDGYMRTLGTTLPELAKAAENLRLKSDEYALETEHATNMTIAMLSWMLAELAFLANTLFGLAAVPALIMGVRQVIMAIMRRLFMSAAIGAASMTGLETLLQAIEILEGTRKHLDPNAIRNMALGGAIGGAVFGAFSGVASQFAPKFANSLLGRVTVGGVSGVAGGAAVNAALGADQDLGLAFLAGAAGAMLGAPGTGGGRKQDVPPTEGLADAVKSLSTKAPFDSPDGVNSPGLPPYGAGPRTPGRSSSADTLPLYSETAVPAPVTAVPAGAGTARGAGAGAPGAPGAAATRTEPVVRGGAPDPAGTGAAPPAGRPAAGLPGFEGGEPAPAAGGTANRAGPADPPTTEQTPEVREGAPRATEPGTDRTTVPPVVRTTGTDGAETPAARGAQPGPDAGVPRPQEPATAAGGVPPDRGAGSVGAGELGRTAVGDGGEPAGARGAGVRGAETVPGAGPARPDSPVGTVRSEGPAGVDGGTAPQRAAEPGANGQAGGLPGRAVGDGAAATRGTGGETTALGGGTPSAARPGATDAAPAAAGRPEGAVRGTETPTAAGNAVPPRPSTTAQSAPVQPAPATTPRTAGGPEAAADGGSTAPTVRTEAAPGAGTAARPGALGEATGPGARGAGESSAAGQGAGVRADSMARGGADARPGVVAGQGAPG
ncbi:WXG100-like domain-containing protein, partial [Streptomyces cinerochromogenes]|uniref:WXG100-like domain-containing protein n=1 Tax=Streptomyces cinerochromogenes TaxID=66422 RepID=UPI0040328F89